MTQRVANVLYNENDPFAAQWLRNLIAAGHLEGGDVDARSITDLDGDAIPERAHFFAGIGGWPLALQLAGFPADAAVWTGSCPCQPLSSAGKRRREQDARHLWPAWHTLIAERRPPILFGEQVASRDGRLWLDAVSADLEALGYAVAAADLCAAGVGAPHIRQRLFWVAIADRGSCDADFGAQWQAAGHDAARSGLAGGLANPESVGRGPRRTDQAQLSTECGRTLEPRGPSAASGLGDSSGPRSGRDTGAVPGAQTQSAGERFAARHFSDESFNAGRPGRLADTDSARQSWPEAWQGGAGVGAAGAGSSANPWLNLEWLPCADGAARPTEPGLLPLAHGVSGRVGKLRAYGNAIVPQVAASFIRAAMGAA